MPRKSDGSRYVEVTDRIVEALKNGVVPWERPWISGRPRNASSGRAYRGINAVLLHLTALERGFSSPGWLTYANARRLGGHVRRGETGTLVIYYERQERRKDELPSWDLETDERYRYVARHFFLFNLDQTDGLDALRDSFGGLFASAPHAAVAEEVLSRSGAVIEHGGDVAAYIPSEDRIVLPARTAFRSEASYYSTAFHEIGHWSGHESRLHRSFDGRFGDPAYAAEELIAELTAAFLCDHAGLDVVGQSASYVNSWLDLLSRDCRAIFVAAREAQLAADYVLHEWEPEVIPATAIGVDESEESATAVAL